MATQQLNIFLSASIPIEGRDPKYIGTADVIGIREAVLALCNVVLPIHRLVWGGHPSITPIVNHVLQHHSPLKGEEHEMKFIQDHVQIYQSEFFKDKFPPDNSKFDNVHMIPEAYVNGQKHQAESVRVMRLTMLGDAPFAAAVFIGGMEGVEDEFKMFKERHPRALALPIASTGAAAKIIYDDRQRFYFERNERLATDYNYGQLFRDLLMNPLNNTRL